MSNRIIVIYYPLGITKLNGVSTDNYEMAKRLVDEIGESIKDEKDVGLVLPVLSSYGEQFSKPWDIKIILADGMELVRAEPAELHPFGD